MKIWYFNDTRARQLVKVRSYIPSSQDMNVGNFEEPFQHHYLEPTESRIFDVYCPKGNIPFVKVWENQMILIDSAPKPK